MGWGKSGYKHTKKRQNRAKTAFFSPNLSKITIPRIGIFRQGRRGAKYHIFQLLENINRFKTGR